LKRKAKKIVKTKKGPPKSKGGEDKKNANPQMIPPGRARNG